MKSRLYLIKIVNDIFQINLRLKIVFENMNNFRIIIKIDAYSAKYRFQLLTDNSSRKDFSPASHYRQDVEKKSLTILCRLCLDTEIHDPFWSLRISYSYR